MNVHIQIFILVYIPWDFPAYCQDCVDVGIGRGLAIEKEIALIEKWQPLHRSHVVVETPRAFADGNGIIIAWVLPSIVPPALQVRLNVVCALLF